MLPRHYEGDMLLDAGAEEVFAVIDDHASFSSHMSNPSWMMGGGRMSVYLDDARGQAIGSHIRLSGRVLGLRLSLDEVVTRRERPTLKMWETVGTPRLFVIGKYSMGVQIERENGASRLRVFIDYELPSGPITRWLGRMFGGVYARWCVDQMLIDVARRFRSSRRAAA